MVVCVLAESKYETRDNKTGTKMDEGLHLARKRGWRANLDLEACMES
jgi:hypothetical protein